MHSYRPLCKSITKNNTTSMYRAADKNRDKVIFYLILLKSVKLFKFPLGNLLKKETEKLKRLNLNVSDKPDSQDICFVPNGDYVSVIEKLRPSAFRKGNIKDLNGNELVSMMELLILQ